MKRENNFNVDGWTNFCAFIENLNMKKKRENIKSEVGTLS